MQLIFITVSIFIFLVFSLHTCQVYILKTEIDFFSDLNLHKTIIKTHCYMNLTFFLFFQLLVLLLIESYFVTSELVDVFCLLSQFSQFESQN